MSLPTIAPVSMWMRCLLWESNFATSFSLSLHCKVFCFHSRQCPKLCMWNCVRVTLKNDRERFLITLSSSLLAHIPGCFPIFLSIPFEHCGERRLESRSGWEELQELSSHPPAQSRGRCGIRPLGVYPACSWKPPSMECSLSGSHFHCSALLIVQKFPVTQCKPL